MDPRLSDFPCGINATRLDRVSYVIILLVPTRSALYSDPDVCSQKNFFKSILNVFNNAVARPSTVSVRFALGVAVLARREMSPGIQYRSANELLDLRERNCSKKGRASQKEL